MEKGCVIAGKYELVRLLGRGSMGEVWVAHHRTLGEDVAIKLLTPAEMDGSEAGEQPLMSAARFRFEAQIAARLSRKTRHIVHVSDYGEEGELAYLVMELLEGETLERLLDLQGTFRPADVVPIVAQVARALEEAHAEHIVHRDLKPANIFVTRDEDGNMLVKLLDFGIARGFRTPSIPSTFATGSGLICGTPGYMSPEQASAAKVDARCDLWALATVAYEAMTGNLPIVGESPADLLANLHAGRFVSIHTRRADLPNTLAAFFKRAFARRCDERFASATELSLAFERAVGRFDAAAWKNPAPLSSRRGRDTLGAVHDPKRAPVRSRTWVPLGLVGPSAMLLGVALAVLAGPTAAHAPRAAVTAAVATAAPSRETIGSAISGVRVVAYEDDGMPDSPAPVPNDRPAAPLRSEVPIPLPHSASGRAPGAMPRPAPSASSAPTPRKPFDRSAVL